MDPLLKFLEERKKGNRKLNRECMIISLIFVILLSLTGENHPFIGMVFALVVGISVIIGLTTPTNR